MRICRKFCDLTDDKWARGSTDGEIFGVIRDGAGPQFDMKGFKGRMTDQDMWNVVNYLPSLNSRHNPNRGK